MTKTQVGGLDFWYADAVVRVYGPPWPWPTARRIGIPRRPMVEEDVE